MLLENLEDRTLLSAPTFTVTAAGDAGTGSGNSGDIRYCINQANIPTNAGAIINFNTAAIGSNTITLTHGELEISNTMTIDNTGGPGSLTISGNAGSGAGSRIFNVTAPAAVVTIEGLTVSGGNGSPTISKTPGNQGGDIFNGGILTLTNDVVENGFVLGAVGGPPARGGGIFNAEGTTGTSGATLTLDNTIVEKNEAEGADGKNSQFFGLSGGPGGFGAGGGVYNDSNASVFIKNGTQIISNTSLGGHGGNGLHGLNGSNNSAGPGVPGQTGGSGGGGGAALGGGLFNNAGGSLSITGTNTSSIVIADNVAQGGIGGNGDFGGNGGNGGKLGSGGAGGSGGSGGNGGSTLGGGLYSSGSILSLQFAQFAGNQALGGLGGTGSFAGHGGNGGSKGSGGFGGAGGFGGSGGSASGGSIYSTGSAFTIQNTQFTTDANGKGSQAIGGNGNTGSNGGNGGAGGGTKVAIGIYPPGGTAGSGGNGGDGGAALGAVVYNGGGDVSFTNVTMTSALAQAGSGSGAGAGGTGGTGGVHTVGGGAGAGGSGGVGGAAIGGGVYNIGGSLSLSSVTASNIQVKAGNGSTGGKAGVGGVGGKGGGGNASTSFASAPGGSGAGGGGGGAGGVGGAAQGGGFYNGGGVLTVTNSQFTNDTVTSGSGSAGGDGGAGGVGGVAGKKFFLSGHGGIGGPGGVGGNAGYAAGGGGVNAGGNAKISGTTFTVDLVQAGNGGAGGTGGKGGEGGDANAGVNGASGTGGSGGAGGAGGSGSTAQGGGLSVTSGTLTISNSTFGGSAALADQVLGGSGGAGGTGGVINVSGAPDHVYVLFNPPTPNGGQGGKGGAGTVVSGGGLAVSGVQPSNVNVVNSFTGIDSNNSFDSTPPDTQGAAGPSEYVETVNSALAIYKKTTGALVTLDSQADFFYNQGGITPADPTFPFQSDSFTLYIPQAQRFVVGVLDIGFSTGTSQIDLAVSKSSSPTTLTANDWYFYTINTTEAGYFSDYPGNLGYNDGAVVFTLDQFGATDHVQVNALNLNALINGQALTPGTNSFQTDISGFHIRPTAMQDSSNPNDPMWFIEEGGDNASINVIKMTNVLSATPTFTTTNLAVNPYSTAVAPLQPDGGPITGPGFIDSRFMNADEQNGLLVAAHTVSDAAGDEDSARWYEVDVSSGTPVLKQQGDVSGGSGVYDAYPGIAINAAGNIGMSYAQSGTSSGQFLSVYVTGRLASDPVDTMETPILIQAGTGDRNLPPPSRAGREGDMSGINVDSDGSFWIANEYANNESPFNWGTAVAHFSVVATPPPVQTVTITDSSFDANILVAGDGAIGGPGGLYPNPIVPPTSPVFVGGNCGAAGAGGSANGGGISLSAISAQVATLSGVDASGNNSTGGVGGPGAIQIFSNSGNAGAGGTVEGGGVASMNYSLTVNSSAKSASQFNSNVGTAGAGGAGGGAALAAPNTAAGGAGGAGGSAEGGGIAFENDLPTSLTFSVTGASASKNQMTAAAGGAGGGAGTWGHDHILGGSGGAGGQALGGGLFVFASNNSINTNAINFDTLDNNILNGGSGALGGAGSSSTSGVAAGPFAAGGGGGNAEGGGLYDSSLNPTTGSTESVGYSTMAGNQLTAGNGGLGGTGTTSNGGPGGNGGNGGNAEGGGFFDNNSVTLTVINSTVGGLALSPLSATANSNILTAGSGGSGNNAGTPQGLSAANGGNGGNAGSTEGGGVFTNSNSAQFVNDTIINNLSTNPGLAGAPGSGAGSGGKPGTGGAAGVGEGGGFFAAAGKDQVGNSILDLNAAKTNGADAFGAFTSLGTNILGSTAGSTGFNTTSPGTDSIATAAQLNLGPLLNNGGPTPTDALLNNSNGKSVAIDAGNNGLITTALFGATPTDQRGPGFPRIDTVNNKVDVGAVELSLPTISSLTPNSGQEGSPSFTMTINGTGFQAGALVNFGSAVLTPTSISGSQIVVTVPGPLPVDTDSPIAVTVGNPDGSGIKGETLKSASVNFTITEAPFSLQSPGKQTSDVLDNVSLTINPAAPDVLPDVGNFSATGLPDGLTINATTGVISGTIATDAAKGSAQTYSVTITAYDGAVSPSNAASTTFSWVVNPFSLANPGTQNNKEGDTASLQIKSSTGAVASNYSATGLPPGLSIDATTGIISGTINPFAVSNGAASQDFTVTVTAGESGVTASTTFTWTIKDTTPPALTNPGTQSGTIGNAINLPILFTDADSFTATGLPTGLSINATTGVISGTLTGSQPSVNSVTVTATDNGISSSVTFTWNVAIPFGLVPPGAQTNDEGESVSLQMGPVTGFTASNYSASGLPPGLSINPTSGLITGTIDPRGAGVYSVTVKANDSKGESASTTFSWTVFDTTPPVLSNPGLQTNTAGDLISHLAILAVDADPGTFTDIVGSQHTLPPGLTIDPNGVISGRISLTASGNYAVTIEAADTYVTAKGQTVTVPSAPMSFLWSISPSTSGGSGPTSPPVAPPPPSVPPGVTGLPTNLSIISVQNSYPGLVQLETVTVDVTNANGFIVNEGIATFQVNGETLYAPVVNGVATVTFATSLLNFSDLNDYLFAHPLTASYSDGSGVFTPSGMGLDVPAIWIDFFLSLLTSQLRQLTQFQST